MNDPGITEIGLERSLGFGPCPNFSFTINADNRYTYEGRRHVEPLGERAGAITPAAFDRLAEVCVELPRVVVSACSSRRNTLAGSNLYNRR